MWLRLSSSSKEVRSVIVQYNCKIQFQRCALCLYYVFLFPKQSVWEQKNHKYIQDSKVIGKCFNIYLDPVKRKPRQACRFSLVFIKDCFSAASSQRGQSAHQGLGRIESAAAACSGRPTEIRSSVPIPRAALPSAVKRNVTSCLTKH